MNHLELRLAVAPDFADILTAELAELGYESFVETESGLNAYIAESAFDLNVLTKLVARYARQTAITYQTYTLEKRNWNAEWEQNYTPIEVAGTVRVRASFHKPEPSFRYELIINPKMSFGTGHHETTAMMLELMLGFAYDGKRVLDVGCGTGILGILAAKMGAKHVLGFDVEEWAVENTRENAALNRCPAVEALLGTIDDIQKTPPYQLVLANINRNVLLADIPAYVVRLQPGGSLMVSGFYETDAPDIRQKAAEMGLVQTQQLVRNGWTAISFLR